MRKTCNSPEHVNCTRDHGSTGVYKKQRRNKNRLLSRRLKTLTRVCKCEGEITHSHTPNPLPPVGRPHEIPLGGVGGSTFLFRSELLTFFLYILLSILFFFFTLLFICLLFSHSRTHLLNYIYEYRYMGVAYPPKIQTKGGVRHI